MLIRETVEAICKHFANDEPASTVLKCLAKGLTGSDIRYVTGFTRQQVEATIKRIRRYARRGDYDNA